MKSITITPQMYLLITLIIENALSAAFNSISKMSVEEIEMGILAEQQRKDQLMDEVLSH